MRVNFETRLKLFFLLIIAGIIGIAAFTYQYYQSVKQVNSALSHSNQLRSLSRELLIDIQDLELNSRSFGLSIDSNYLSQYREAKAQLNEHLSQINNLTIGNSEFEGRLRTLSLLINQTVADKDKLIEVAVTEGTTGASAYFKTASSNDMMEHIRFTLQTIYTKEDILLSDQNRAYESKLLNLRYAYYALLISLLAAVCIIGYFTIYQTRLRKIRQRKLVERERQLDRKVKESLKELKKQYDALREIAEIQSHQVRGPVATMLGLINLFNFKDPADPNNVDILLKLKSATEAFDEVIDQIVKMTNEIEGLQSNNN